jgi:hypothetical protein
VAIVRDDNQRVELSPPYPSACLPRDTSLGYPWVSHTLSLMHPGSMVGYYPTRRPTKRLSLWDPINPICSSTQSNLLARARRSVINQHRRGLPPQSSDHENTPLPDLPIRYSPHPLVCPTWSQIVPHSENESHNPHRTSIDGKGPITSGFQPLAFY